tara:strand:- start:10509 stop:11396 length:888 start_codon:yes stop_codon:yes gene_type:complete
MMHMKLVYTWILIVFAMSGQAQETGKILFFQTDWGRTDSWDTFCQRTKASGYDGLETWMPNDDSSQQELKTALEKHGLSVGFLIGTDKSLSFEAGLKKFSEHMLFLVGWKPTYINCHTGSDFFTMDQNRAIIAVANKIGKENAIPTYHETHRGRFSFNLSDTERYLKAIPDLRLNLDISHWMVVHESLLERQDENLREVIDRSDHLHARVGHAEGPQVNDPEAPEWKVALDRHLDIWEAVIRKGWQRNNGVFTLTTEFGPADYMPTLHYTRSPVADQWKLNVYIKEALKKRMNIE